MEKFYKSKYILAFYDNNDRCTCVYDNVKEFAQENNMSYDNARSLIAHLKIGSTKTFKKQKLYLIDMTEKEEELEL